MQIAIPFERMSTSTMNRLFPILLIISLAGPARTQALDVFNDMHPTEEAIEAAKSVAAQRAETDFSNEVYRIEVYGLRGASTSRDERYLIENFDIQIIPVTGCVVWPGLISRIETYNHRMIELLNAKHGRDIFQEAIEQRLTPDNRDAQQRMEATRDTREGHFDDD